jgi:hypothetical protein
VLRWNILLCVEVDCIVVVLIVHSSVFVLCQYDCVTVLSEKVIVWNYVQVFVQPKWFKYCCIRF